MQNGDLAAGLNGLISKAQEEQKAMEQAISHHASEAATIGILMRALDKSDNARQTLAARLNRYERQGFAPAVIGGETPLALTAEFREALNSGVDETVGHIEGFLDRHHRAMQEAHASQPPPVPHGHAQVSEAPPHYGPRPAYNNPMRRTAA